MTSLTKKLPADWWKNALVWAGVILVPIVAFGIFLQTQGVNAIETYGSMIASTLGTSYGIGEVVIKSTPLVLIAVATAVSAKAGLINVGGEGQFAIGGLAAAAAGMLFLQDVPGVVGIPVMALAGIAGGMLWSGIAGVLRVKANMNETITTLILNYIAVQVVSFFVYGPLKDPDSFNWPQTSRIASQLELPTLGGGRVSIAIFFALGLAVLIWLVFKKTKWGYKLRVIGGNPIAAAQAGYHVAKNQLIAMLVSGALAGFAGMLEISGVEYQMRQTTGTNYGYLGFLAAWMAWNNPLLGVVTAFIIGFLSVAGNTMEITSGLPSSSIRILMSIVLLAILWKGRRKKAC